MGRRQASRSVSAAARHAARSLAMHTDDVYQRYSRHRMLVIASNSSAYYIAAILQYFLKHNVHMSYLVVWIR